jgi:hypothetical protein
LFLHVSLPIVVLRWTLQIDRGNGQRGGVYGLTQFQPAWPSALGHFLFRADLLHAGWTGNFSKKYLGRMQSPLISSAAGLHAFWAAKWALFFCYGPNLSLL